MSEHPIFFVGNRDPSITTIITDDSGTPINLTGKTVRFKAREVDTSALIVDQLVSNSPGSDGVVRYDWSAADIATNGILFAPRVALVWWEVTSAGKKQDVAEAVIQISEHAPGSAYVELEELKSTLELTQTTFGNLDIERALPAASRALDEACGRRFYLDADATSVRYYSPGLANRLWIDDLVDLTAVAVDTNGDGSFGSAWSENSDFVLAPLNAPEDGWPWTRIELHPLASSYFPSYPRSVKVMGQFGWAAVPDAIAKATTILATQLLLRARQAPFGVLGFGLEGEAVRIARTDPHIEFLIRPYVREKVA